MGGSFSREIRGSFSGRERAPKGFEEFKGKLEIGPGVGMMGGPREEEEGGANEGVVLGGADEGVDLGGVALGRAALEFAFGAVAVFFFLTVSHCFSD